MTKKNNLSPKQIVAQLDQYIIGQRDAKRAVAIALRNRYRRGLLDEEMRNEIIPKNILMIGPTGVGKTEIARRIARVVHAPFVKVEATKFTEVGYVGRDVESMIRDLVENAVRMIKEERIEEVQEKAKEAANEKLIKLLVPSLKKQSSTKNPFDLLFGAVNQNQNPSSAEEATVPDTEKEEIKNKRERIRHQLLNQELEDEIVTVEVEENPPSMMDILPGGDMGQMAGIQDALGNLMPKKKKKRKVSVSKAREILTREEAQKLIDMDDVTQTAVQLTEQNGIVFIDEVDKIASRKGNGSSADVSREGVQRDILPIVEGSTVTTKYGPVKTDFILFIAAGAFHMSKPADLIPELQGRFPIRVELQKLTVEDFYKILVEPDNALLKQYTALLGTEDIAIQFTDKAIRKLAQYAFDINQDTDNIGARRLHTILEKVLEELSFEAPDIQMGEITITPEYIEEKLGTISKDKDLSRFIL